MAWPLRPLGSTQIQFPYIGGGFEQLVADTLGDYVTEKDGFDAIFNASALSLPADDAAVTEATPDLLNAGFIVGEFEAGNLLPLAQDTADFTGAGDPLAQSVDSSSTAPQPAAPTFTGGAIVVAGGGSSEPPGHATGKGPAPLL